jgi:Na+-transporting methylmalonyl-CoA/oxaloacetate decarboxylase gamma subunit
MVPGMALVFVFLAFLIVAIQVATRMKAADMLPVAVPLMGCCAF